MGYKITHFPNVKTKAESNKATKGETKVFGDWVEAAKFMGENSSSPSIFKEQYRKKANFLETSFIVADIDENLSIKDAEKRLKKEKIAFYIHTTVSHTPEKEKFRIFLPLEEPIQSEKEFKKTANKIKKLLPEADKACFEPARYFLGNPTGQRNLHEGNYMKKAKTYLYEDLMKKIQAPEDIKTKIKDFFKKAPTGLEGKWNQTLNKVAYSLSRAEIEHNKIIKLIEDVAPNPLDDSDLKTIASGFSAGQRAGAYKMDGGGNVADIVEKYIESLNVNHTPKGIYVQEEKFDLTELVNFIYVEMTKKGVKCSTHMVSAIVKNWYRISKNDGSFQKEFIKPIKFNSLLKKNEINQAVRAISRGNYKLNQLALEHWIWQVKRKIIGLPVVNHLMLVLYGKSGSGKTMFLNKLIEPLKPFIIPSDVSMVNDNREYHNFCENYIVFFDEMAHAGRADVNKLKNIITSDTVSFRMLGTNSNKEYPNNSSFIGASNTEIVELIKDPTSARRYYQINTLDKLDWDVINKIDYTKLWQEVDENKDSPLKDCMLELASFQEEHLRSKDSIEEWQEVNEIYFCQDKKEKGRRISPSELYTMYTDDQKEQGRRIFYKKAKFFKKISEKAPQFKDRNGRYYLMKKDMIDTADFLNLKVRENEKKKQ